MGNVKQGTLYCDVFGDSLMAKSCEIIIMVDGQRTFGHRIDLSERAIIRLNDSIVRCTQPFKPRKKGGESDGN